MQVNKTKCIGCSKCLKICPVNAISMVDGKVDINQDLCVECGVCFRVKICPVNAFEKPHFEIGNPRLIRYLFSDPTSRHPITDMGGRGTVEMKTNDVTERFKVGEAGIGIEVGRPGISASISDVEKIYKKIITIKDIQFEKANPVSDLIDPKNPSQFKKELLKERVLSAIIEFKIPTSSLVEALGKLKDVGEEIDTVFSVCLIDRVTENGKMENIEIVRKNGYKVSKNLKVCVGLGKLPAH